MRSEPLAKRPDQETAWLPALAALAFLSLLESLQRIRISDNQIVIPNEQDAKHQQNQTEYNSNRFFDGGKWLGLCCDGHHSLFEQCLGLSCGMTPVYQLEKKLQCEWRGIVRWIGFRMDPNPIWGSMFRLPNFHGYALLSMKHTNSNRVNHTIIFRQTF